MTAADPAATRIAAMELVRTAGDRRVRCGVRGAVTPGPRRMTAVECTCGSGVWGTCDYCGVEAWVNHRCPFPCDDVTCENGSICVGCLTGRPCPMHNGDDWEDEEEDWNG